MSSLSDGTYGRRKVASSMDILYLLLPIIGAFLLLFLVCCFGKKVKEMLHIPKELVLGRNFSGLASSTSSSSSSRSSFSDSDNEDPAIVININMERQRVLSQHRRRYTQVPSTEMVFSVNDCHTQQGEERGTRCQVPRCCIVLPSYEHIHRKSKNSHRRSDSCPLLAGHHVRGSVGGDSGIADSGSGAQHEMVSDVSIMHTPYRLHQADFFNCRNQRHLDTDSDSDTTSTAVPEKLDRQRHRSNSESDLPQRVLQYEQQNYLEDQRLSQCAHRLASTEFQLHAPQYCSSLLLGSDCDQCSNNQAEVG